MSNQDNKSLNTDIIKLVNQPYKYGFSTKIEKDIIEKGLNEDIIRLISKKKNEPKFLLEFRLKAYKKWKQMKCPKWARLYFSEINYQDIIYYSAPIIPNKFNNLDEVDPKLLETFEKLGISLSEQKRLTNVAVDAVFDSLSIGTTFKKELSEAGVIFCSISEAVKEYPNLIKKYLGTVVPIGDNYFSALNSAVFTDGSFCYIPKQVKCPLELSTYFRINEEKSGQFERTLIIADEGSYVHYVEGCTAPIYSSDSLHSAVVEIIVKKNARVRYTTIQNWSNNVYNLVTKRATCAEGATMEWIDGNIGSKVTMKYPAVFLMGPHAKGETLSIAFAGEGQHQDAGAKNPHGLVSARSHVQSH